MLQNFQYRFLLVWDVHIQFGRIGQIKKWKFFGISCKLVSVDELMSSLIWTDSIAPIIWVFSTFSTTIISWKCFSFSLCSSRMRMASLRALFSGIIYFPGWTGLINWQPQILLYLEAGITRPRWPCNPPPRLEVTDIAFALICFCSCLSVLKFGCPAILATVFCEKKNGQIVDCVDQSHINGESPWEVYVCCVEISIAMMSTKNN